MEQQPKTPDQNQEQPRAPRRLTEPEKMAIVLTAMRTGNPNPTEEDVSATIARATNRCAEPYDPYFQESPELGD